MSFFKKHAPKTGSKRKHIEKKGQKKKKSDSFFTASTAAKSKKNDDDDDEIDSDEFDDDNIETNDTLGHDDGTDGEEETPQDKRLRLAKKYLQEIENEEKSRAEDNQDMLEHSITQRLNKDYLDSIGKLRRKVADTYSGYNVDGVRILKHKLQKFPITCFCVSADEKFIFSGCKNSVVVRWELGDEATQKFSGKIDLKQINGNGRPHTVAIAISTDFKYLAIADGSKSIYIWCPESLKHIHTFEGHRDSVTGVIFRRDSHTLYSTSKDRSVKIWSLDEMAYVETLFGHQFPVTSIDTLSKERVITSGGSDRSVRIWKITEESQLLFHGHKGNIEHVKLINEEHFLSSADDGSLCSWSVMRKKPLCTLELVHGVSATNNEPNWITAIATLLNTDVCASGSCDGFIRLWKLAGNSRTIEKLMEIPVNGFVNSLAFTSDGSKLIVGVGQEHRLGRWWTLKDGRNCIMIIPLLFK